MSAKFTVVAATLMRTCPGPGSGIGAFMSSRTSGGPYFVTKMAYISASVPRGVANSMRGRACIAYRRRPTLTSSVDLWSTDVCGAPARPNGPRHSDHRFRLCRGRGDFYWLAAAPGARRNRTRGRPDPGPPHNRRGLRGGVRRPRAQLAPSFLPGSRLAGPADLPVNLSRGLSLPP